MPLTRMSQRIRLRLQATRNRHASSRHTQNHPNQKTHPIRREHRPQDASINMAPRTLEFCLTIMKKRCQKVVFENVLQLSSGRSGYFVSNSCESAFSSFLLRSRRASPPRPPSAARGGSFFPFVGPSRFSALAEHFVSPFFTRRRFPARQKRQM